MVTQPRWRQVSTLFIHTTCDESNLLISPVVSLAAGGGGGGGGAEYGGGGEATVFPLEAGEVTDAVLFGTGEITMLSLLEEGHSTKLPSASVAWFPRWTLSLLLAVSLFEMRFFIFSAGASAMFALLETALPFRLRSPINCLAWKNDETTYLYFVICIGVWNTATTIQGVFKYQ